MLGGAAPFFHIQMNRDKSKRLLFLISWFAEACSDGLVYCLAEVGFVGVFECLFDVCGVSHESSCILALKKAQVIDPRLLSMLFQETGSRKLAYL